MKSRVFGGPINVSRARKEAGIRDTGTRFCIVGLLASHAKENSQQWTIMDESWRLSLLINQQ
jgi:hypothetical protein